MIGCVTTLFDHMCTFYLCLDCPDLLLVPYEELVERPQEWLEVIGRFMNERSTGGNYLLAALKQNEVASCNVMTDVRVFLNCFYILSSFSRHTPVSLCHRLHRPEDLQTGHAEQGEQIRRELGS